MLTLWIILLITTASAHEPETNTADTNITTLYPVYNRTIIRNEVYSKHSDIEIKPNDTETRSSDNKSRLNDTETKFNDTKTKTEKKTKPPHQSWKLESSFAESNLTDDGNNSTNTKEDEDKKVLLKDFKPSQHLGSFFDDDSAEVIKTPVFGSFEKQPASGFISSPKDEYPNHSYNNIPKEIYQTHEMFPYKFEDTIYTKSKEVWQDSMESKPTVEVPVKVPAGGFYKSPDAFKKPHSEEDFALEYHEGEKDDGKEHAVKKRVNPWQNLLRLVTAFIPVGLIISALTPSVITIHNVGDNQQPSPNLPYRRSDTTHMAPISERCRRRLLCELHSDRNYLPPSTIPRRSMKHCHKIQCEDTEALWRMLRWLFTYNKDTETDQRARNLT